jgi:hypothetical protein
MARPKVAMAEVQVVAVADFLEEPAVQLLAEMLADSAENVAEIYQQILRQLGQVTSTIKLDMPVADNVAEALVNQDV